MPSTVSGHPAIPPGSSSLKTYPVAGGRKVTTVAWAEPLFVEFLRRWETHRALGNNGKGRLTLSRGPLDSYEYRQARSSSSFSDHCGYAVDIRYDVLLADQRVHMTPAETAAVREILSVFTGLLAWGGPWASWNPHGYRRLIDEMHVFVAPNVTAGMVGKWANSRKYEVATVIGGSPMAANRIAQELGCSTARLLWFNPWLATRKAVPGDKIVCPPGVKARPLYLGPDPSKPVKPARLAAKQIATVAKGAGFTGDGLVWAVAVALAESDGDPACVSVNRKPGKVDDGSRDRGLWQINDYWHSEVSDRVAFDPVGCAKEAFRISDSGRNWKPWSTFNNGMAYARLAEAKAAV